MYVDASAQVQIAAPPEAVYDYATDEQNFSRFMQPLGPIPGVTKTSLADGAVLAPGVHRNVQMSDGSSLVEEILSVIRPREQRYRWLRPPATPLALFVRGAESTWTFQSASTGTQFSWHYRFELKSVVFYPLGLLLVALFKRWMQKALERVRDATQA
jgi:uncharacterized protein YndB with AHSA1/START domain